jgi:hypothetical protein
MGCTGGRKGEDATGGPHCWSRFAPREGECWEDDEEHDWQFRPQLEGFVFDIISGDNVKDRLKSWLPKDSSLPDLYKQLAEAYRRQGNEQAARAVAINKERARRTAIAEQQAHLAKNLSMPFSYLRFLRCVTQQAWSAALRGTIGYGYRPARALIPLVVLILVGSLLFDIAYPTLLRPMKSNSTESSDFNSFRYTVDLLLPVANFKQRDYFVASGWVAWVAFMFIFAGWLLAAIVVAGLAGVFKSD